MPKVNKWLDLLDRAGWTAIQSAAGATLAALALDDVTWETALVMVGGSTLAAVCKVVLAQRSGDSGMGDAIPGASVIEPPPT